MVAAQARYRRRNGVIMTTLTSKEPTYIFRITPELALRWTSGASGDIWMATLLLRCPKSIQVEDRRAGMAIYTPPALDPRSLPFKTFVGKTRSVLGVWGNTTLIVLMVFLVSSFLLPLIFNILQVPSFVLGTDAFWLIRWQNNVTGFGLTFNLVSLLLIAAGIGIFGVLEQAFSRSKSSN
jgi:hypothetical protein